MKTSWLGAVVLSAGVQAAAGSSQTCALPGGCADDALPRSRFPLVALTLNQTERSVCAYDSVAIRWTLNDTGLETPTGGYRDAWIGVFVEGEPDWAPRAKVRSRCCPPPHQRESRLTFPTHPD
jgi:hypothetical protein